MVLAESKKKKRKEKNQIDRGKNEQLPYRRLNDWCVKVDVS